MNPYELQTGDLVTYDLDGQYSRKRSIFLVIVKRVGDTLWFVYNEDMQLQSRNCAHLLEWKKTAGLRNMRLIAGPR